MKHCICIHGHFYQPPRENAWLETVELQESAAPFHDWNERINHECYAPNAASRILDEQGCIQEIVSNYRKISFNFGPTLLSWMEANDPDTYHSIIRADKESVAEHNGHGNAIAQVHSHLILPLCNRRDKETQVIWGIKDFESRFGRKPEGMWLAETAADTETLEVLAEKGIRYTILAPRQAKAVRRLGESQWRDLGSAPINTRIPYTVALPSGRSIAIFFYDGNISQDVAFSGLLFNGKELADRFLRSFLPGDEWQLAHIATDGETYGHHHRSGDMALSFALNYIEEKKLARIVNYAEFLELCPPRFEVQIHDNSSWSCVHGIERWRANCGCNSGGKPGWTQHWRAPLREALDWLRDQLIPIYDKEAGKLLKDPIAARNDYLSVVLDRSPQNIDHFFMKHAGRKLAGADLTLALRLLEMQRHTMYMYTSCGWFFDEISGIETSQILQYACRAIDYARQTAGLDLEKDFLERLAKAPSNMGEYGDGAGVFKRNVYPARVSLEGVGMHYGVASIFEKEPERMPLFNFTVTTEFFDRMRAGSQILAIGRAVVKSKITFSEKKFSFAALYLGQHNLIGNISTQMEPNTFNEMYLAIKPAFQSAGLGDVIGVMQQYFGLGKYSIRHLFKDEKRQLLNQVFLDSFREGGRYMREIYTDNYQLMTEFIDARIPVPEAYKTAVAWVLNEDLSNFVEQDRLSLREFQRLVYEFRKWRVMPTDVPLLGLKAGQRVFREMQKIGAGEMGTDDIERLNAILGICMELKFNFDKWRSQNLYFEIAQSRDLEQFEELPWVEQFVLLGEHLGVRLK